MPITFAAKLRHQNEGHGDPIVAEKRAQIHKMNKDTKGYVSHRTRLVGRTLRGKGYSSSIVRSIIISSCLMKFQVFLVQETEGEDSQLKNISPGLHHFAQYFKKGFISKIRIF